MKKLKDVAAILAISLIAVVALSAQSGIDPTYNALPLKAGTFNGQGQVIQPDGKMLIWGGSLVIDGVPSGFIARINTDGSRDTSFNFCGCGLTYVNSLLLQPDGKILVSGNLPSPTTPDFNMAGMARINADGSADNTFTPYGIVNSIFGSFGGFGLLPDGKIMAVSSVNLGFMFGTTINMTVLNPNGTSAFGVGIGQGQHFVDYLGGYAILPDGRFYLATTPGYESGFAKLNRYNANGAVDPTWPALTFQPQLFSSYIDSMDSQPNGDVLVGGIFTAINGTAAKNIARLTPAGTVDPTFVPPGNLLNVTKIKVLPSGKILIIESVSSTSTLRRLNADGSLDPTFVQSPFFGSINNFSLDPMGRIVFIGTHSTLGQNYYRLNPDGDLDASFVSPMFATYGTVAAVTRQADNKVLIAGDFDHVDATARSGFARLNDDGTADGSFDPGTGFDYPPSKLLMEPDGKIVAMGHFNTYNGAGVSRLIRINTNGGLDNTFTANLTFPSGNGASNFTIQADGKILLFGDPFNINSADRYFARLNSDGSTDVAFNPVLTSKDQYVGGVVVEPDGKLTIGGFFTAINGTNRQNFARLNSDGTLDTSFNPSGVDSQNIFHMLVKGPDGKYYHFNSNSDLIGRWNADGSADTSFQSPEFDSNVAGFSPVNNIFPRADGTLIVTGFFNRLSTGQTSVNRHGIVRLRRNGSLDGSFIPSGVYDTSGKGVTGAVELPNDKILLGGDFTKVNNIDHASLARLNIQPLARPSFDFDGDGKTDVSVFRPGNGNWYLSQSSNGLSVQNFGLSGDVVTPGDFDGDGKADLTIWRPATGTWWYKSTVSGAYYAVQWGQDGDIPLAEDFNGDGRSDFVIYRPINNIWFRYGSNGQYAPLVFGTAGDIPLVADMDGDGKADPTIYRPSTGTWWYASSVNGLFYALQWGTPSDIPVPGDYDGDGKTDPAYFRPSNGDWYVVYSGTNYTTFSITSWGLPGDRPTPGDYDGDGKTDLAIYRPSNGMWFAMRSASGFFSQQFGLLGDKAVPNAFLSDPDPGRTIGEKRVGKR